jgi:pimeloyl-ACP methyl ester carboxylesterase
MADHIQGPLYYERIGRSGAPMAFVHPNPLDQSCWMYQMAHFSTWYRCLAIDIPGYGRSPKAEPGLRLYDIAAACWDAVSEVAAEEGAILVGCSVGAQVLPYMVRQHPERAKALIMTGVGYNPAKEFATRLLQAYSERGVEYRWEHLFQGMSPAFRSTPLAHYFADLFVERNKSIDIESLLHQFRAHQLPDPDDIHSAISCPSLIITGTEDGAHANAFKLKERIPGCELKVLPGGGHTCHLEQPWVFDRFMLKFLADHDLLP